ncbi:ABC transporter ATP-binding protein [Lysinibacillus sp. NPDC056185]|uniref:ABC transporter ATP-binding protein n=1 Tax=Lysinibacillus sp. NPDC056185 TaxID=3345739 RepID=UPI0039F0B9D1
MELLNVCDLDKIYKSKVPYTALSNINLKVNEGEFVGIMGPSGSGKTTLLNTISTIDAPSSGKVILNGKEPHQLSKEKLALFRRRELGFVHQTFNLLSTLTVKENIILPLTLDGVHPQDMNNEVLTIAEKLGISNILNKYIYEISGGQAQRVAIARAIIHSPKLILADEPTGNLDSKAAEEVMEELSKINNELGTTIMLVTHDAIAASYCDRIIFIKDGKFYNEIYCGDNRKVFYQKILDVLSLLGG